jgi:hypothetical protein
VSDWHTALGALILLLSLAAGALLSRWYVTPAAEVIDLAWCPAERTEHLHRFHADDTRTCCACGNTVPTAVPR